LKEPRFPLNRGQDWSQNRCEGKRKRERNEGRKKEIGVENVRRRERKERRRGKKGNKKGRYM
jgi:hypothetical protein